MRVFRWPSLLSLLLVACATSSSSPPPPVRDPPRPALPDEASLRKMRDIIRSLPPIEDEPFDDYLARAKAQLLADGDRYLASLVIGLPTAPALWKTPYDRRVLPVLVGAWARARSKAGRVDALRSLITHPTQNPRDVDVPGRSPAFDAMEADVAARAAGLGLAFDHVEHVAWEVGLPRHDGALPRVEASIGVLTHADVVPADEPGWTHPPFAGVLEGGRIIGRGALDDKGAIAAVLYALAALQDTGAPFARPPRLIIGTSEETHWHGIERYQKVRGTPAATVVADASFPVGIGEKGIATARVTAAPGPATEDAPLSIVAAHGGVVSNQVPARAQATLAVRAGDDADALATKLAALGRELSDARYDITAAGDRVEVLAYGKAAHSAEPERGHNALSDLAHLLARAPLASTPCARLLGKLDATLGRSSSGAGLGLDLAHEKFSPTTVSFGLLRGGDDGGCEAALNIRWPPPTSSAAILERVRAALAEPGVTVEGGGLDPFLVDADAPLVRTLRSAYRLVTGERGDPVTVAGTTYAKAVPGAITFGPEPEKDAGGRMHAANEYITTRELGALVEMYAFALMQLSL